MEEYIKDPAAIEAKSFAMIKARADLSGFDAAQRQIVMRLVHSCGNLEVAQQVRISDGAVAAGIAALQEQGQGQRQEQEQGQGQILCDVEMVKQGLTKRLLKQPVRCFLNHPQTLAIAAATGETRTMSALQLWQPHLAGAIVIIGNAPTALFRLMEMLEEGWAKPALIIGMPVGFVGAPESKNYLWRQHQSLGVECMTIQGRSGGSALAAGAFNTLLRLC